ncbi:hypothetical protein Dimus_010218 [Dionaea muscipula]
MGSEWLYYTQLLHSCNTHSLLHHGRQLHPLFLKKGILNSALTVGNRLLQMYVKCGSMVDARTLFDEMPQRNCFSWNTLIEGYMVSGGGGGDRGKSLELFQSMPQRNEYSWNVVISGLAKAGDLRHARLLFDQMPMKNGIACNSMIHGYYRHGHPREALRVFKDLNLNRLDASGRNSFVLATVVSACTHLLDIDCGKQILAQIIVNGVEFDPILGSSLVNLYGKCGDLDSARHVLSSMEEPDDFSLSALITGYANVGRMSDARSAFDQMVNPSVVVWNSVIAGYVFNNEDMEALVLFNMMRENGFREDFSTVSSLLCACTSIGGLGHGKQLHAHACKLGVSKDVIVSTSLIDMYSKCGSADDGCKLFRELEFCDTILLNSMINVYCNSGKVQEAKQIFDTMPHRTLISWNSMIVGLSQNGWPHLALDVFRDMNDLEIKMDKFSLASVISACASISALEHGEQAFARATIIGLEADPIICTSLIDFYCKCGCVDLGRKLFSGMENPDQATWNSMLMGYATNGHGLDSLNLFNHMQHVGVQPNDITFTAILSACDHCGLVKEARKWFHLMHSEYYISPGFEHYSCMIDLLARAGCLEEAMGLIEDMPFDADSSMWSAVLRGCTAHGNRDLGEKVAALAMDLDPTNAGAYVQLASVFASSGDWHGSSKVRSRMKGKNVEKNPAFQQVWSKTGTKWGSRTRPVVANGWPVVVTMAIAATVFSGRETSSRYG